MILGDASEWDSVPQVRVVVLGLTLANLSHCPTHDTGQS